MRWEPIITAPKDGSAVLGYFPSRRGYLARQDVVPILWTEWGCGNWQSSTSGHQMSDSPTHWMPIPEPPNE